MAASAELTTAGTLSCQQWQIAENAARRFSYIQLRVLNERGRGPTGLSGLGTMSTCTASHLGRAMEHTLLLQALDNVAEFLVDLVSMHVAARRYQHRARLTSRTEES